MPSPPPPPQSWTTGSTTTCTHHRQSIDSTPPTSAISHTNHSHAQPLRLNDARYPESNLHNNQASTDKPRTYPGSGTSDDPYIVDWDLNDPENPYNWSTIRRWFITAQLASTTFTVSFSSSAYSGGLGGIQHDFNISDDVAILGISLYVVGFALGYRLLEISLHPEGSRRNFLTDLYFLLRSESLFQLGGAFSKNLATLLSCRLLTGICGSSPLTNAGGAVSDIWNFRERGLASAIYATVPFLGPGTIPFGALRLALIRSLNAQRIVLLLLVYLVIGPIAGGFVAENPRLGWHFNFWIMMMFSVSTLVIGYFYTPETYKPVLLRRRAQKLQKASNNTVHYSTSYDLNRSKSFFQIMRTNLSRPFVFVISEPIVLLLAIYISIVYGTLYALFSAFPIVFQQHRGFSPGQGGLAFIGVGVGVILGTASQSIQNRIYWRSMDNSETGRAPPEARLHMAMVGAILAPVGLWWFAWTSKPSIHWIVPILAGVPFGIGVAQILQSLTAYLMDTYNVYFASAIAATVVLRSCCGAAFPLFSPAMFAALGDQWAMSVFAALSTACMPIPVLFWKYGWWIRSKSRVAFKDSDLLPGHDSPSNPTTSVGKFSQLDTIHEKDGNVAASTEDHHRHHHHHPLHYNSPHPSQLHRPSTATTRVSEDNQPPHQDSTPQKAEMIISDNDRRDTDRRNTDSRVAVISDRC
ncbi:hypothetical protein NP233_g10018 [Leucocoprinus birnbaumii]|uniref:Uncharacterized protein n=1 Tax=Leucocoprinus birnbaumii TaxID=56174 RepID=A0AAD5VK24_9AGAR|nr:hypothetical protein NP233_g10018 [Leucocoprinus birnbaumii]